MGDAAIFFYCSIAVLSCIDKVVADSYNLPPCYFWGLITSESKFTLKFSNLAQESFFLIDKML